MLANIKHRSYIPSEVVRFGGLSFNGGTKGQIECTMDMIVSGPPAFKLVSADWHESFEYSDESTEQVSGKPDWFHRLKPSPTILRQETLDRTAENLNATWKTPSKGSHALFLLQDGGNPLVPLSPNINLEVVVSLRIENGKLEYAIDGKHDGFPAYEISIDDKVIWSFDPVAADEDPSDLLPPMEHSIAVAWTRL